MTDTSDKYIKMCTTAIDLQNTKRDNKQPIGIWSDDEFSPISRTCHTHYMLLDECSLIYCPHRNEHYTAKSRDHAYADDIWLPRQDDIQELLMEVFPESSEAWQRWDMLEEFHEFIDFKDCEMDDIDSTGTFEQWWLHFYMKKVHNKVWYGKEWKEE